MNTEIGRQVLVTILRPLAGVAILIAAAPASHADPSFYTNGVGAYILRAQAHAARSNWDNMITECDKAIRLNPNAIDAYRGRGAAHWMKDAFNEVISNYSEVIRLEPNDANAHSFRAYAYSRIGNLDKAIEDYTKVISLDSKKAPNAYLQRARAYGVKRDVDKSISDYDRVINLEPKNSAAYFGRGYQNGAKKEYGQAVSDFSECIRLNPTNARAFFHRGNVHAIQRDFGKAASDLAKAHKFEPENVRYANTLAWLLATCPDASSRDGRRAVEIAKKVCEATKWDDGRILDTLAAAFAETGDFQAAVRYQTLAMEKLNSTTKREQDELKSRHALYEQVKPYREAQWQE